MKIAGAKKRLNKATPERIGKGRRRLIVKFHDNVTLPYVDGVQKHFDKFHTQSSKKLLKDFPGLSFNRFYGGLKPNEIKALIQKAAKLDPTYAPHNFFSYFAVDAPLSQDFKALIKGLRSWSAIDYVLPEPTFSTASVLNPENNPLYANQGYLQPAHLGINAPAAWNIPGGDGEGVKFADIEGGWNLNHEDIADHNASLLIGENYYGYYAHGTSVLGIVCAKNNDKGIVGVAPNVDSVMVASIEGLDSGIEEAILKVIQNLSFGDVMLIEIQLGDCEGYGDYYPFCSHHNMPVEARVEYFHLIRLATALGIVVVEVAGDGNEWLDGYMPISGPKFIFRKGSPDFQDSGAIMVSASTPAGGAHFPLSSANYGSRIDCFAWGEGVETCSTDDSGTASLYTSNFNGTSAAAAIIAGAALSFQGICKKTLGYPLSPGQIRYYLSCNGSISFPYSPKDIGVMPDFALLTQNLINAGPDVYLRDYVGDTGLPGQGIYCTSPDIIVCPEEVQNPEGAFGQGSGNEDNVMCGFQAEFGQDNYIYARLFNCGGTAASGVTVKVYWSPPASLITPDQWHYIGACQVPSVPAGNVITVSGKIKWNNANVPPEGHYCLIALAGTDADPIPAPGDFQTFDDYYNYISANNNVAWRNIDVVDNEPNQKLLYVPLEFLAVGARDRDLRMRLSVEAKLPKGARLFLEAPIGMAKRMLRPEYFMMAHRQGKLAVIPINPFARTDFEEITFPAKSKTKLRLLAYIPKESRRFAHDVSASQLYRGKTIGRVTWRLAPRLYIKKIKNKIKA